MRISRYLAATAALVTMISAATAQGSVTPQKPEQPMGVALKSRASPANMAVVVSGMIVVFAAAMLLRRETSPS